MAEIVWVLGSFYHYPRARIAEVLMPLVSANGVVTEQADLVVAALSTMAVANVAFVDAYLSEVARAEGGTVASFDRNFRRLNVAWIEPS